MSVLQAILLGLFFGLSTGIPVSETGQMTVLHTIFGLNAPEDNWLLLSACMRVAAALALAFTLTRYLRHDWKQTAAEQHLSQKRQDVLRSQRLVRRFLLVCVAFVPSIVTAVFRSRLARSGGMLLCGIGLFLTGIAVYVFGRMQSGTKTELEMTSSDALLVGIGQALSVFIGFSGIALSLCIASLRGLREDWALWFSYQLAIPALLLQAAVDFVRALLAANTAGGAACLASIPIAAVAAYFGVRLFARCVQKKRASLFSSYCWCFGVICAVFFFVS